VGRPPDTERRARTLAKATDYVLAHGLVGLSLRPLAATLNTSTRMLLYDFGSKEALTLAVLNEARRREAALLAEMAHSTSLSTAEAVRVIWAWVSAAERAPFLRLFFEVYVDAFAHPDIYSHEGRVMVTDWLKTIAKTFRDLGTDPGDTATPTLIVAVVRGLLLDRLATADTQRTDEALGRFADLVNRR
jgi:AcrR family transcriptional regulator